MAKVRNIQPSPTDNGTDQPWQCVVGPAPEKVFIWDRKGNYLDCHFPNPVYGHFLGAEKLIGRRLQEVLPAKAAQTLQEGIDRALYHRQPSQVWITLTRKRVRYRVCIRMILSANVVLGWVNDIPVAQKTTQEPSPRQLAQTWEKLSETQQHIVRNVVSGRSNKEIAQALGIKEGTVKFHLTNIFRNLNLESRVQLAVMGKSLGTTPPVQQPTKRTSPSWVDDAPDNE